MWLRFKKQQQFLENLFMNLKMYDFCKDTITYVLCILFKPTHFTDFAIEIRQIILVSFDK